MEDKKVVLGITIITLSFIVAGGIWVAYIAPNMHIANQESDGPYAQLPEEHHDGETTESGDDEVQPHTTPTTNGTAPSDLPFKTIETTPDTVPNPSPGATDGVPITIAGEITCLPKVGSGMQTLECAIGLRADSEKHYALRNMHAVDPEYRFSAGGMRVVVVGALHTEEMLGPDGNRYDIVGVIDVKEIREAR